MLDVNNISKLEGGKKRKRENTREVLVNDKSAASHSQLCSLVSQASNRLLSTEKSIPGVSRIYKQHITLIRKDKQRNRKMAKGYEFTEEEIDRPTDRRRDAQPYQ